MAIRCSWLKLFATVSVAVIGVVVLYESQWRDCQCICEVATEEQAPVENEVAIAPEPVVIPNEPDSKPAVIKKEVAGPIVRPKPRKAPLTLDADWEEALKFMRLLYQLDAFHSPRFRCNDFVRIGTRMPKDGGYHICMDDNIKPNYDDCVVYSFGINKNWSFDDGMAKKGCKVYSHDPSIGKPDHKHSENVWFFNTGLDGYNAEHVEMGKQFWKMRTFDAILKENGHTDRVIDYFKFDIEKSEFAAIPQMLESGSLINVKQFATEFHFFYTPRKGTQEELYASTNRDIMEALEEHGFYIWHREEFSKGCPRHRYTGLGTHSDCIEAFFVNSRFLKPDQVV